MGRVLKLYGMRSSSDEYLLLDITFALSRSPFRIKSQRPEHLEIVATDILKHLKLANWRFERNPPVEPW